MTLIPAFPLGTSFLPGEAVVLRVFEPRYLELVAVAMETDRVFVSSLISAGSEVGGGDKRFNTGVLVEIDNVAPADFGLMLYGHATEPVNISSWNEDLPYPRAECHPQTHVATTETLSAQAELASLAHRLDDFFLFLTTMNIPTPSPAGFASSLVPTDLASLTPEEELRLFWSLARLLPSTPMARYEILIDQSITDRTKKAQAEIEHLRDIVAFRYGT